MALWFKTYDESETIIDDECRVVAEKMGQLYKYAEYFCVVLSSKREQNSWLPAPCQNRVVGYTDASAQSSIRTNLALCLSEPAVGLTAVVQRENGDTEISGTPIMEYNTSTLEQLKLMHAIDF